MIGLARVIAVPLDDMTRRGQELIDHSWIGWRLIGADFAWAWRECRIGHPCGTSWAYSWISPRSRLRHRPRSFTLIHSPVIVWVVDHCVVGRRSWAW